jgi:hypothetical protein
MYDTEANAWEEISSIISYYPDDVDGVSLRNVAIFKSSDAAVSLRELYIFP